MRFPPATRLGTITTELLPQLPGYLPPPGAGPSSAPRLSLAELDAALGRWISTEYHARAHSETKMAPLARWAAGGWLPRMPDSLEQLDLLLLAVAKPRIVHRDGIRFAGLRYLDLTAAINQNLPRQPDDPAPRKSRLTQLGLNKRREDRPAVHPEPALRPGSG